MFIYIQINLCVHIYIYGYARCLFYIHTCLYRYIFSIYISHFFVFLYDLFDVCLHGNSLAAKWATPEDSDRANSHSLNNGIVCVSFQTTSLSTKTSLRAFANLQILFSSSRIEKKHLSLRHRGGHLLMLSPIIDFRSII